MKISIIGPIYPFRGGIAQHTALLAAALQQAGHTVQVVSFKRQYPTWLYPGKSDREPDAPTQPFPAAYILDPLKPGTWRQALGQVRAAKPDLVLIIWWTTFWSPADASLAWGLKRAGVRVVYLIHNVLPHEARFFDRLLARLSLRQGQGFILQIESQRLKLLELLPKAAPVAVAPMPVFAQFQGSHLAKKDARLRLSLPDSLPVVLFFGIVRPYKGLKYLVDAVGILAKEGTPVRLVVAGEFWEDINDYRQQADRAGITGQVTLVDRYISSEEVGLYFSAADIFAAPYTSGTQSAAVKAALGFGLPLVMTDILVDPLVNQPDCPLQAVPAGDAAALAKAIRFFLEAGCAAQTVNPITAASTGWNELVQAIEGMLPA